MTFFSFIILSFCAWFYHVGQVKNTNVPIYSEPQFKLIISKFTEAAALRNVSVNLTDQKITFEDLKHELAHCYYGIQYMKFIRVDRRAWARMTQEEREATLFHELGHCVLGRIEHADKMYPDGCPVSLMHTSHTLKNCYFKNRSAYLDELFQQKRN
jgi:hypothetical protein